MKRMFFMPFVFIALVSTAHGAVFYKCIGSNGNIIITDNPPPDAKCESRNESNESTPKEGHRTDVDSNPSAAIDSTMPRAEIIENLAYTHYTADADSTRSLPSILNASSPLRHDGSVVYGYYNSNNSWKLRWFRKPDGRCKITKVTIEITGEITLPRLEGGTYAQRARFDTFLSALRVHELGHHDINKEAAAAIGRKILSLPEMTSCTALESAANDLGQQTINEYKERTVRYDAETNHGRSQGARLDR